MVTLVVLAFAASLCGIATADSGCPFYSSLQSGQSKVRLINKEKALLIANGFLVPSDEPGESLVKSFYIEPDHFAVHQKSNTLLIAQQFYLNQQCPSTANLTSVQRLSLLSELSKTIPLSERCAPDPVCDAKHKYVTYDGSCNNLENPKWGKEFAPYTRMVPAVYDDDIHTVRKSVTTAQLTSVRKISNLLLLDPGHRNEPLLKQNVGSVFMAQLLDHDLSLRRDYQNDNGGLGLRCCSKDYTKFLPDALNYYGCLPMEVPSNDPFLSEDGITCMNFIRGLPTFSNECKLGAAEHANAATHIMDHSAIYGSNSTAALFLRSMESGKLKIDDQYQIMAKIDNCEGLTCYFSGDIRAGILSSLGIWHSIYIRFHNKIADKLIALDLDWSDEKLYQETRRIVIAVHQNIIYNEWLPLIIGNKTTFDSGLSCGKNSTYCGAYNASVNPSTLAEFSHSAFRLFHINVPDTINFYNANYEPIISRPLSDLIDNMAFLETNYMDVIRGNIIDPANYGTYTFEMRRNAFKGTGTIGVDVASFDIARGRDTGLSPYHVYLNLAVPGGYNVRRWNDLSIVFSIPNIIKLKQVYESPLDIDLFVGLMLEEKNFSYLGLVATYMMVEQFKNTKFGNRFFYSFANGANPFTADQIAEINNVTWASVLCESSDIEEMLVNAFQTESPSNTFAKCSTFPSLNAILWKNSK